MSKRSSDHVSCVYAGLQHIYVAQTCCWRTAMPLLLLNVVAFTASTYKMVYYSIVIALTLGLNCATHRATQRVSINEIIVTAQADHTTLTFCTGTSHIVVELGVHHAKVANTAFFKKSSCAGCCVWCSMHILDCSLSCKSGMYS